MTLVMTVLIRLHILLTNGHRVHFLLLQQRKSGLIALIFQDGKLSIAARAIHAAMVVRISVCFGPRLLFMVEVELDGWDPILSFALGPLQIGRNLLMSKNRSHSLI